MTFRKAGQRNHTIDFEIEDGKEREALMECIEKTGKFSVRLLQIGDIFDGRPLTAAYEQIID